MSEWSCPVCDTHVDGWTDEQIAVLKRQHAVKHKGDG